MRSPRRPAHTSGAKNAHAVRWREITSTPVAYNPEMRHKASAEPPLQWRLAVLRWLSIAEVLAAFDTAAPLWDRSTAAAARRDIIGGSERKPAHVRPGRRQASPHD